MEIKMRKIIITLIALLSSLFAVFPCQATQEQKKPIIVFDFGGVIAEQNKEMLFLFLERSLHLSPPQLVHVLKNLRQARARGISDEQFWSEYAAATKTKLPQNFATTFSAFKQSTVRLNPKVIDLVKTLRSEGYQVALLSNSQKSQAKIIKDKGLQNYFDPLVLSCEIGVEKPNLEAYRILLKRLETEPKECILIDDCSENIQAAQKAGMEGILFQSIEGLQAELAKRNIPA
jgi:putative hydrolase of the HAD superfamily